MVKFFAPILFLLFVSGLLGGCIAQNGTLNLNILQSPKPDQSPISGYAESVRIRIDGPHGLFGPEVFPAEQGFGVLHNVRTGEKQVITVEGLTEMKPVSRGRSSPLNILTGENLVELFVGRMEEFSTTPASDDLYLGAMAQARAFHSATLLNDGSVLFTGGVTKDWRPQRQITSKPDPSSVTSTVEILEANSLHFEKIDCDTNNLGCMNTARIQHCAAPLPSGNILIAGGTDGTSLIAAPEIFSASTKTFIPFHDDLHTPRYAHACINDGQRVAIIGGINESMTLNLPGEFFEDGALGILPQLNQGRHSFSLVRLSDGTLMASGGYDQNGQTLASIEFLAPQSAKWQTNEDLSLKVSRALHTATLLNDGSVLLIGGLTQNGDATTSIERYDHQNKTLDEQEQLSLPRWAHTATLLLDERILVVGGFGKNEFGSPTDSVEQIAVTSSHSLNVIESSNLSTPRAGHTATLLQSGMLLVAGGLTEGTPSPQPVDSAEIFVY